MLFFWTFHSLKNPEKKYLSFHRNMKMQQLFLTMIIIITIISITIFFFKYTQIENYYFNL